MQNYMVYFTIVGDFSRQNFYDLEVAKSWAFEQNADFMVLDRSGNSVYEYKKEKKTNGNLQSIGF